MRQADQFASFWSELFTLLSRHAIKGTKSVSLSIKTVDGRKIVARQDVGSGCSDDTELPGQQPSRSSMQQAILDVLETATSPMKATVIARQAGKEYEPHFRAAMAALKREEIIIQPDPTEQRWWLASREIPEES